MPAIHEVATITSKGQITLPKPIRQALGVDAGGKVAFDFTGDRVIVTQNNAYYNICNGDVGVLHIRGEKPHRVAALAVRGTLKTWQIDRGQGEYGIGHDDAPPPQLALAYALTVHKSQGSQYDTVLMPVSMATARMLYRNLLYTAISRAGKEVILVGSREALNTAMQCIPYPRKSKLVARTNLLRLGRSA